jgi:predicted CopG family antitoxin
MNIPGIMVKTLKISDETHRRLSKIGVFGETFEDIIIKLLDEYEARKRKEK